MGLLEERFESCLEDVEFGLRCARAGCGGRYVPEARAWHQGGATLGAWSARAVRLIARNQVLLAARYCDRLWPALAGQALWSLVALRHGSGWACLRGKLEGLRRWREFRSQRLPSGDLLEAGERQILAIQRATGSGLYWRLYFALTHFSLGKPPRLLVS